MNEDLLRAMMGDVDPARDLTDETLDELVPRDHLMAKIMTGIGSDVAQRQAVRVPIWRRVPAIVGASTAAMALAIAGAVSLFGSAPLVIQGTALGPSKSVHKTTTHGPVTTGTGFAFTSADAVAGFVVQNDRYWYLTQIDGRAFRIAQAPASMKTPLNARAIAAEIWATAQLRGYSPLSRSGSKAPLFGFGIVTITKHVKGVPVVTKVPAWVGFARETALYHCPAQTSRQSTQQLLGRAAYSGLAAVVVGQPSGSPAVVYVAKSVRCGRLYPAVLSNATEQFSLSWTVTGKVGTSKLAIEVTPPPCGRIVSNAVAATWRSGSLSSITITEYGTVLEYTAEYQACPAAIPVRKVIDLRGASTASTKFIHPKTGPMTVVANHYK